MRKAPGGQFAAFHGCAARMPPCEPCRPRADAQAGQHEAKAARLEAHLGGRGGAGRPNKRGRHRRDPKPDGKAMAEQRMPEAGQFVFEAVKAP